jgi:SAM-dependent methyltransferase
MRDLEPRTKNQEPGNQEPENRRTGEPELVLRNPDEGKGEDEGNWGTKYQTSSIKNYGQRTTDNGHFQFSILNSQFDVVTCFYDSLNYLTGERDLDQVCAGVARALRPGGVMVFDMNTAAEYATWDERDCVTYDGRDCLVYNQLSYDPDAGLATGRIVWFVRELDRWWRGEETHTERAWSDDAVRAALCGAGLELIGRYDTVGDVATGDVLRVVCVARRADRAADSKARCEQ